MAKKAQKTAKGTAKKVAAKAKKAKIAQPKAERREARPELKKIIATEKITEQTRIVLMEKPKLSKPIFIEGLPGIGYVGRNVAGFLVEELKAKKFAEIYSHHFPPVVLLDPKKTGRIIPIKNELYYWKAQKRGQRDLIILIGDAQSMDPVGHYEVAEAIIETVKNFGAREMITLGGFATGVLTETKPKVFGAAMDLDYAKPFDKLGVKFKGTNIGQIIGASGLLIAIGQQKGVKGVVLMGETSGMLLSDPRATEAVLEVLSNHLKIKFDLSKIEERVKELEKVIHKIEELQAKMFTPPPSVPSKKPGKEELGYIG